MGGLSTSEEGLDDVQSSRQYGTCCPGRDGEIVPSEASFLMLERLSFAKTHHTSRVHVSTELLHDAGMCWWVVRAAVPGSIAAPLRFGRLASW